MLKSLSGKTLEVLGRRIVQLDCGNGHSLSVQFDVCRGISFQLVSVVSFLLQDFWTVMSEDYLALTDPNGNAVPIVRQGTSVYLTPAVIPYKVARVVRLASECLPDLLAGSEGVCDCFHPSIDRLPKIGMLIAAANTVKVGSGPMDHGSMNVG